MQKLITEV